MDDLDLGATLKGFSPGQKIFNRYTLKKILGRGGMGVVWLARDEELERDIALKFLPEIVALDPEALSDLKRETRRNLDLTHPHIVRIYDFVSDSHTAAISMEYVDGASLSALKLEKPGRVFTVAELRPMLEQLCAALTYAHTKAKIVHRDLKPANLMVTQGGDLKITDFGIARGISDSVSRVSAQLGGSSGTPVYMSPQQMMGEKAAVTDDIYAIGATLYELLTGKPPFHSGNIIMQVQAKVPPPLAERRAELGITGETVPSDWETLIAACLAKEAPGRPQSTAEVAARLRGETAAAGIPPPVASSPRIATAAEAVVAPPVLAPAPAEFPGHGISGARRWVLAPLIAALLPALACAAFMMGWRALSYFDGMELLQVGLGTFVFVVPIMAIAAIVMLGLWRLCGGKTHPLLVGLGAFCGAACGAGVISFQAHDRLANFNTNPGLGLFSTEIFLSGLLAALIGAVAAYLLRRFAFGVPVGKPLVTGSAVAGGLLISVLFFGFTLPRQFDRTYTAEGDRQHRIWEEQDRLRREAELAKATAEAEALKLKQEQETAAQRELREREAIGLIREAHRMVFDRAPDQRVVTRYTNLMITNPDWNAARLRQELRKSADGIKGGRLLVPEEFPTITAALAAAIPGNAVHVAPGTYNEALSLNKAVNLIGAGRDRVIVQSDANRSVLYVSNVNTAVTVRGFTFRHSNTLDAERRHAVVGVANGTIIFQDNLVENSNGNGFIVRAGANATVRGNQIRGSRWDGVVLYEGANANLIENTIENNQQVGVYLLEKTGQVELSRNTIRGNLRNGIYVVTGDNTTINDNRVSGNGVKDQNYGGIGIGGGRPTLRGNVSRDNIGAGIWWRQEAQPVIGPGNINDGTMLPVTP